MTLPFIRIGAALGAATLLLTLPVALRAAQEAGIQDNSFLVEEAYNQEAGVVQHIATFARWQGGEWGSSFTQEWPLGGIRHQLSYSVPLESAGNAGLGDVMLNYRLQAVGSGEHALAVSPRLSALLPTGSARAGRGAGGFGVQAALPVTWRFAPRLTTVANVIGTIVPQAENRIGDAATTLELGLGGSLIWSLHPRLNLLVEGIWSRGEDVVGEGRTTTREEAWLNPGVRWAFNLAGGWQVVPGVAYTIGVGPTRGEDAVFLYLSVEHPFRR